MKNIISKIIAGKEKEQIFEYVLNNLYQNGPVDITDMEILCYLSIYFPEDFRLYENRILKYMGLNYKHTKNETLKDIIFDMYSRYIIEKYNYAYTPIQANIVEGIDSNKCFSFSAPTSTGKSFVFRNIISNSNDDVVIVVPSRALINEYYHMLCSLIEDKTVNILTFIDKINVKKAKRNVFIVTPERCKEIFKLKSEFKVEFFLFDEAQLGNEENNRGIFFDSIIRRAQKAFPNSKFIFAHPFVNNPEAQIKKNHFDNDTSKSKCYLQRSVGQMFYLYENDSFYHFGIDKNIMGYNKQLCQYDPIKKVLDNKGSVLIYTSKTSIYKKSVFIRFKKYMDMCTEIQDEEAIKYIHQIKKYIGASEEEGTDRYSMMLDMLKHGIVIHHGSLPLQARLLVEQFTQKGYCKICFATSTLEQGVNMPFDLVYINRLEKSRPLSLKNLIGRAGRSSTAEKFDFGSVVVKGSGMSIIRNIMSAKDELEEVSWLEQDVESDMVDFKEAILNNTLSDDYNITQNQLEVLKKIETQEVLQRILNTMFKEDGLIDLKQTTDSDERKKEVRNDFAELYEIYLGRTMEDGERNVFDTAIKILLWKIQCKTFKDICFYRYAYASQLQKREELKKTIEEGAQEHKIRAQHLLDTLPAAFTTECNDIPNKKLNVYSMFAQENVKAKDVDYDRIVFDTYDYLDKIIGFKLSDVFVAAFEEYYNSTNDIRAKKMSLLIKYGTIEEKEIWMLRYGFAFEDIEWLVDYIEKINQEEIIFKSEVEELPIEKIRLIERYL